VGTLYRRYGSKTELLQRLCVLAMEQALAAAEDALAAADPWDGLCGYITACVELRSGALASLAGQIETTAGMRGTAGRSMARLGEIVARAQAAGVLRADVTALDISWLIEQFSRRRPVGSRRPRSATCGPGWSPSRWTGSGAILAWLLAVPGSCPGTHPAVTTT
jgi:AcrR family transcriptional regulator